MNKKTLVINIRRLRESKHLKQEYVAEQIKVSPATYSKLENGKVNLSAIRLQQIATALQVPVPLLLAEEISPITAVDCREVIAFQKQQLIERDQKITKLEQEQAQSLEREQRLLNYIKMLEQQAI